MRIGMNTTLVLAALTAAYVLETRSQNESKPSAPTPTPTPTPTSAPPQVCAATASSSKSSAAAQGGSKGRAGAGPAKRSQKALTTHAQAAQLAAEALELEIKAAGEAAAEAYAACPKLEVLVGALLAGGVELMKSRCTGDRTRTVQ